MCGNRLPRILLSRIERHLRVLEEVTSGGEQEHDRTRA
jgi:hypothetical protein